MNRFNQNNECANITRLEKAIANLRREVARLKRRLEELEKKDDK